MYLIIMLPKTITTLIPKYSKDTLKIEDAQITIPHSLVV